MLQPRFSIWLLVSLAACIPWALPSHAQDKIEVKITVPERDGIEVGKNLDVKGTASVPTGHHLWVLVHRVDFEDVWYPQNEGKIDPKTREWKVTVTVGGSQDIGWEFDIAVVVVKDPEHILLRDYRTKAMKSGDWRPIEMPTPAAAPLYRKVKKTSH